MKALFYSGEVLIGYGPVMVLWLIGVGMGLPFSVAGIINGEPIAYLVFSSLALGSIGMWGIIQLLKKLIWRDVKYPINKYRIHLMLGCIAVIIAAIGFIGVNNLVPFYFVMPILITWHFYHVCSQRS